MSKFAETDLPCPCGKSSDAWAVDHEGRGFCFSCSNKNLPRDYFRKGEELTDKVQKTEDTEVHNVEYVYSAHRGLSEKTVRTFDIKTAVVDGVDTSYILTYPNGSVKVKRINPKSRGDKYRWVEGDPTTAGLFGRDKFEPGSKKVVIVTEGDHDAAAVYEITGGKYACVSVTSSSTALRDIKQDRDYLNSFDKIFFCFDNDDPGKEALRKVMSSGLFDFNKVYQVPLVRKDANEYLQENDHAGLAEAIRKARKYSPDNIISTFDEISDALKESKGELLCDTPIDALNEMTYGFFGGQVWVVKGMEGIGKTEIFRFFEYHILKNSDRNIAMIHMEEDKSTTIRGVATYELGVPANLPEHGVTDEKVVEAYKKAVGDNDSRAFIYTMFGGDDPDDVLDSIRFLVATNGVEIVFLDHITLLATGKEEGDERRQLDYLSTKLKKMAMELGFCLVMITHVNDEGQTRGSRNISKIADILIDLYRNKLSDDPDEQASLLVTLEKNRKTGRTGRVCDLFFDKDTFKLEVK